MGFHVEAVAVEAKEYIKNNIFLYKFKNVVKKKNLIKKC